MILISFIVNMAWDKNHLGVEATDRSLGGALDGGVDGEGGQMPVWMLVTMMMIMPVWLMMMVMMMIGCVTTRRVRDTVIELGDCII